LATISPVSFVQANGLGRSFQPSMNAPTAMVSWRTQVTGPRQMAAVFWSIYGRFTSAGVAYRQMFRL
jgi:hypothetical protein